MNGKFEGAKEEREKINKKIEIENKNNKDLKDLADKQKSNNAIMEKNNIIQTMKDERDRLNQKLEEYKSLFSIDNKPLEDKVNELKKDLKKQVAEAKNKSDNWLDMTEQTEEVLEQIICVYKPFENTFSDVIKNINKVNVIVGKVKDMLKYLKHVKRKVEKNGVLKKIPPMKIKEKF